mmetsp:Transcript_127304/g.354410  ORF Transcript_127304/g.354410 Transcript_127304/m.354410 type:complete len:351 (-) Transcript_127304:185-1237(-)
MPGVLRAVAPAYAALSPDGGYGPWLPEPGAKRAWPDSMEDLPCCGSLGLDAFECPWVAEPCQKRPRLGARWQEAPPKPEASIESGAKRQTPSAQEVAKRRRLGTLVAEAATPNPTGPARTLGPACNEAFSRRVAQRTEEPREAAAEKAADAAVAAVPAAPGQGCSEVTSVVARDAEEGPRESGDIGCTEIVSCSNNLPKCAARILNCIRESFLPCSLDFRDVLFPRRVPEPLPLLPFRLDSETLQGLGIVSLTSERMAQTTRGGGHLPGLVVFKNGRQCIEPMESLLSSEAEEPTIPGFVIYDDKRTKPNASSTVPRELLLQWSLRASEEQDEEEEDDDKENEEARPMVI